MDKEIFFEKKKTPQIVAMIVFLGLELLIFPKAIEYYGHSNFVDLVSQQLIIIAIFVPVFWKLQTNNTLQLYDDGVSYTNILKRKFLRWNEITEVKIFQSSISKGLLLELVAENKKVTIPTAIFRDEDKVVKFLDEKLKKC